MDLVPALLVFAAAALVLVLAGTQLARAGDQIATITGAGGFFVGVALTAAATSAPEAITDVAAVLDDAPRLAVGDLFGSSMANMTILAVLDLMGRHRVWPSIDLAHARSASIAIGLTALALLGIVTPEGPTLGWVGLEVIVIAVAYGAALAWLRRARLGQPAQPPIPRAVGWGRAEAQRTDMRSAAVRFGVAGALVLVAGPLTAISAKDIADAGGLGQTFVGVAMLAVATSLPELVASLAALRIGAYDLAVGNLFGSNAVNMALLLVLDVAYVREPLLTAVAAPAVLVAGVGAILLMALALSAVVHGAETRIRRLEPDATLLLVAYVGVLAAVWATT